MAEHCRAVRQHLCVRDEGLDSYVVGHRTEALRISPMTERDEDLVGDARSRQHRRTQPVVLLVEECPEGPGDDVRLAARRGLYVWSHSPTTAELDGFAALVEAADDTRSPD